MTPKKSILTAAMVGALVVGASACGEDGGHFDGKEPAEIAEESRQAMLKLTSLTMEAEFTSPADDTTRLKSSFTTDGECSGTIEMEGARAEFLSVGGSFYFKASDEFWEQDGMDGAAMNKLIGDRWITLPEGQGGYDEFCSLDDFLAEFSESDTEDKEWAAADGEKVNGITTVGVSQTDEDGTSTLYIADSKDAYILKMVREGDGEGLAEFTDFNKNFSFSAPSEDDTVDFSELEGV